MQGLARQLRQGKILPMESYVYSDCSYIARKQSKQNKSNIPTTVIG